MEDVKKQCENMDQKMGVEIIERACRAPVKAIANNAGFEVRTTFTQPSLAALSLPSLSLWGFEVHTPLLLAPDSFFRCVGFHVLPFAATAPSSTPILPSHLDRHSLHPRPGPQGSVIVGELLKQATSDVGFNAQTGEYVHMIEKGIMDPTKVSVCVCV